MEESPDAALRLASATHRPARRAGPVEESEVVVPTNPLAAEEPTASTGSVHVTAFPWGDVSVDGTRIGRCPLTAQLSVGVHRIVISSDTHSTTRTVRVARGVRTEVDVDFEESPSP